MFFACNRGSNLIHLIRSIPLSRKRHRSPWSSWIIIWIFVNFFLLFAKWKFVSILLKRFFVFYVTYYIFVCISNGFPIFSRISFLPYICC